MKEAQKTRNARSEDFYRTFMAGTVLDIGCGDDLCVATAAPFDKEHGDANHILSYLSPESFDCVHSSHCLEHMYDPKQCIQDWWKLVKPGGYLVTVVPDEDLYEQGNWPSLFNPDHKSTFRLGGASSWSPVSHDIRVLIQALPGAKILSARRQNVGYVRGFRRLRRRTGHLRERFERLQGAMHWRGLMGTFVERCVIRAASLLGVPYDQTRGTALAQIEIVAQKQCDIGESSMQASAASTPL